MKEPMESVGILREVYHEILRGVYPEILHVVQNDYRMTTEGFRMTNEGFGMTLFQVDIILKVFQSFLKQRIIF